MLMYQIIVTKIKKNKVVIVISYDFLLVGILVYIDLNDRVVENLINEIKDFENRVDSFEEQVIYFVVLEKNNNFIKELVIIN